MQTGVQFLHILPILLYEYFSIDSEQIQLCLSLGFQDAWLSYSYTTQISPSSVPRSSFNIFQRFRKLGAYISDWL